MHNDSKSMILPHSCKQTLIAGAGPQISSTQLSAFTSSGPAFIWDKVFNKVGFDEQIAQLNNAAKWDKSGLCHVHAPLSRSRTSSGRHTGTVLNLSLVRTLLVKNAFGSV